MSDSPSAHRPRSGRTELPGDEFVCPICDTWNALEAPVRAGEELFCLSCQCVLRAVDSDGRRVRVSSDDA